MDVYKKIDADTLEITSTRTTRRERRHLQYDKQRCLDDITRTQKDIEKIDEQLNVLKAVVGEIT